MEIALPHRKEFDSVKHPSSNMHPYKNPTAWETVIVLNMLRQIATLLMLLRINDYTNEHISSINPEGVDNFTFTFLSNVQNYTKSRVSHTRATVFSNCQIAFDRLKKTQNNVV